MALTSMILCAGFMLSAYGQGIPPATGNLNTARVDHTAPLLSGGKVRVPGGRANGVDPNLDSAEFYKPPMASANNSFRMTAIFSDQAGLYQYIQLEEQSGFNDQHRFAGLTLEVTSRYGVVKTLTFPTDLADTRTAGRPVLIGRAPTIGEPAVDFKLPAGFFPTDGGTIVFAGVDVWSYDTLPTNGQTLLHRNLGPMAFNRFQFRPFTGLPTLLLVLVDPVIEYYNQSIDRYFISAAQPDIDALDSGRISGWVRTGETFNAYISVFPQFGDNSGSPPDIGPVCRLYLPPGAGPFHIAGNFHLFSAYSEVCSELASGQPESVLETPAAFYASLPDPQTGACGYGQLPVYGLWNAAGSGGYRYTASQAVRDLMLRQGYVAEEPSGPGAVAMCVGGAV